MGKWGALDMNKERLEQGQIKDYANEHYERTVLSIIRYDAFVGISKQAKGRVRKIIRPAFFVTALLRNTASYYSESSRMIVSISLSPRPERLTTRMASFGMRGALVTA
jgi:hypothetical protein